MPPRPSACAPAGSTPIFDAKRRVLGTFALYFRKPGRPAARHQRETGVATDLASVALTRAREISAHASLVRALGERVKELTLLHKWAALLAGRRPAGAKLLARLAALLPTGWQHPEACAARVTYGELEARSLGLARGARTPGGVLPHRQRHAAACIESPTSRRGPPQRRSPLPCRGSRTLLDSLADMLAVHAERRQAQASLRDREAMFRSIFENAPIGVTMVDLEGRIVTGNQAFSRMVGYTEAELRQTAFAAITHPGDVQPNDLLYRSMVRGDVDHFQLVKRYVRKDGIVWGELDLVYRAAAGTRAALQHRHDRGHRQRAQARGAGVAGEARERFRLLAESSPDATLIHQDERIVFVNRAMLGLMWASDPTELVGQPATFMLAPEQAEAPPAHRLALRRAAAPRAEQSYRRLDGTTVDVEIAAAPIVLDGRPAAQVTVRDITARLQAEAALRESERRFRGILEGMTIGFVAFDAALRFTYVNSRAEALLERAAESLLGRTYGEAFPEAVDSPFEAAYRKARSEQVPVQTEAYFAPWQRWFEQRVEPHAGRPVGVLPGHHGAQDRRAGRDPPRVPRAAHGHAEPRLAVRRGSPRRSRKPVRRPPGGAPPHGPAPLPRHQQHAGASERRCSAAGDRGHAAADAFWQSDLVASLGGDEFAVLLGRLAYRDTSTSCWPRSRRAASPVSVAGMPINVEASLGIALYPAHGETPEVLWQHADVALRTAKERARTSSSTPRRSTTYDPRRLALLGELGERHRARTSWSCTTSRRWT